MIEINKRNAKMWSRIGIRAFYGQALSTIAKNNANVLAVSADLGRSSGLDRFSKEHPEQFLNTGIAEQSMVGVSSGLARMGFDVFASTFAPFASMRASEQVRMNMGYMHEPVKLVALGSGLAMGFLGNSHYGLEDLAIMRAIPGLTIVSPADCSEIYKTLIACLGYPHPVYIRLTGAVGCPIVYENDYEFEFGKAIWLRPIQDVTIISSGTTVGHCLRAAQELEDMGIHVGLLNMHTVKPLDRAAIAKVAQNCRTVFVIDEHTKVGGLGSAVIDHLNEYHEKIPRIICHNIPDQYVSTGNYKYLLAQNALDVDGIKTFISNRIGA